MSVNSYEEFLKDPLKLEERLPTMEEVLLATNHFFPKTNGEEFNKIKERIEEARDGKRKLDWNDIPKFLSCFDFGNLDCREIWWTYEDFLKKYYMRYTQKNGFICAIMMNIFANRWNLKNTSHWLSNVPKEEKPFSKYLCSELAPKLLNTNGNIGDKYRKWLKNESTPSIDSFIEFWESIKDLVNESIVPQKEILFAYWFWQKFKDVFDIEDKIDNSLIEKTSNKMIELVDNIAKRKKLDSLEKTEKTLYELKTENFFPMFPYILNVELYHLVYQRKYKDVIFRLESLSKIFFTYPGPLQDNFYSPIVSCIAHFHQSDSIEKDEKKKLISIFKNFYEKGIYYNHIDSTPLSNDSKENIEANIRRWSRRFEDFFPKKNYYEIPHKNDYSFLFPKPNVKKADSLYINFGECLNTPQISFFSRVNDLEAVNKLLENKTIQVTKIGNQNDSAIFWSVVNMNLLNPYGFFLQTIFPPTPKNAKNLDILKIMAPYYKNIFNEQKYKESFAQQVDTAREIFFKLVNRCKSSSLRNKSLDDFEKGFSKTNVGNETILQNAIYSARYDIVESTINLYKHFVSNNTKVRNWINEKAGFAPVPAIYHAIRIYSNKQHIDLHLEIPLFHYNRPVSNDVNAEYQQILFSTQASSLPEKKHELEQTMAIAKSNNVMQAVGKNTYVIIDEFVNEDECLKILRLLLDNGADPLIEVNMEHEDNGPSSYNALKFAIEIGWLKGVEMMCEHIKNNVPITQKMIDEWLKVGISWEDQWRRLWKDIPHSRDYAKKCNEVVTYLQTLNASLT